MNDWGSVRGVAVAVLWVTVGLGLVLLLLWLARGGARAFGPDDELMVRAGSPARRDQPRITAFGTAQVGIHGLLGLTATLLMVRAVSRPDYHRAGYLAVVVVLVAAAVPGLLMFRKWRSSRRPSLSGDPLGDRGSKVEDTLPRVVVYAHGLAAAVGALLVIVLLMSV